MISTGLCIILAPLLAIRNHPTVTTAHQPLGSPRLAPLCRKQAVLLHINYAVGNEQLRQREDFQFGCWLTLYAN